MYANKFSQLNLLVLLILLFGCSVASALEIEPGFGAGLRYTDNAALTSDNEDDDLIVSASLGAQIRESTGTFTTDTAASLLYDKYTKNTFGDRKYFKLAAGAGWEMIEDRLNWQAVDYFTTIRKNSLNSDAPDNLQNTNAFTTGPNISFSVSPRNSVIVSPVFRDYYFENSDTDNQQYELNALWSYQLYRTMTVGPDASVTKIDYENDDRNVDVTDGYLGLKARVSRPRAEYAVNLGENYIWRDGTDNVSGYAGNLDWRYSMTENSSLRAYVSSALTDTSSDFLQSKNDPDTGDFLNEQVSSDVLRNKTARLTYQLGGKAKLDSRVWLEYRDLDYKENTGDRKVKNIGATFSYRIKPLISTGVSGSYDKVKETDAHRTDKEYFVSGNVSYSLSPKLSTSFRIGYRKKDSTVDSDEFNEFSASVYLVYGFKGFNTLSGSGGHH